jgi:hypothetical protein
MAWRVEYPAYEKTLPSALRDALPSGVTAGALT